MDIRRNNFFDDAYENFRQVSQINLKVNQKYIIYLFIYTKKYIFIKLYPKSEKKIFTFSILFLNSKI